MGKKKKTKKFSTRGKMLFVCILSIVLYTIASFSLQFKTQIEISPTLTTAFFSFWGWEVWNLARIKINKDKKMNKYDDYDGSGDE